MNKPITLFLLLLALAGCTRNQTIHIENVHIYNNHIEVDRSDF